LPHSITSSARSRIAVDSSTPIALAERFKIRKPLLSTGQIWQGRVHSRPRGRDFVVVSFFEGETNGFQGDTDGFETN
jgi:hypothetical protein